MKGPTNKSTNPSAAWQQREFAMKTCQAQAPVLELAAIITPTRKGLLVLVLGLGPLP